MSNPFLREEPFQSYGTSHWCVLALFVLAAVLLVRHGRRVRSRPSARTSRRALALTIFALQVPLQIYSMLPRHWDVAWSLPFQLCDLAWMAAIYALWTDRPWALGLLYYWGLTLTPQAILTPQLDFDFPHIQFIMFWASHCLVVLAAIFTTWGLGRHPRWRHLFITGGVTLAWALLMLLFNALAGTNYLYVSEKPAGKTVLDLFGPWPCYVLVEIGVILMVWSLMTIPWYWIPGRKAPGASPPGRKRPPPARC